MGSVRAPVSRRRTARVKNDGESIPEGFSVHVSQLLCPDTDEETKRHRQEDLARTSFRRKSNEEYFSNAESVESTQSTGSTRRRRTPRDSKRRQGRNPFQGVGEESIPAVAACTTDSTPPKWTSGIRGPNPVNWTMRYSGQEDLLAFLESVEREREFPSVEEKYVLLWLDLALTGRAGEWYWNVRDRIHSWEDFKVAIRSRFLPACSEDGSKSGAKTPVEVGTPRKPTRKQRPEAENKVVGARRKPKPSVNFVDTFALEPVRSVTSSGSDSEGRQCWKCRRYGHISRYCTAPGERGGRSPPPESISPVARPITGQNFSSGACSGGNQVPMQQTVPLLDLGSPPPDLPSPILPRGMSPPIPPRGHPLTILPPSGLPPPPIFLQGRSPPTTSSNEPLQSPWITADTAHYGHPQLNPWLGLLVMLAVLSVLPLGWWIPFVLPNLSNLRLP